MIQLGADLYESKEDCESFALLSESYKNEAQEYSNSALIGRDAALAAKAEKLMTSQ